MGASTVAQLIAKGQAENKYNNSGISSSAQWWDFFNDALRDMVDDLGIEKVGTISFAAGTREYNLPSGYYSMLKITDGGSGDRPVNKRREYSLKYPSGYWIFYRGTGHVIDFYDFSSDRTFTYTYKAYATALTATTDTPEVPAVGEKALIYYALAKALRNNSQLDDAKDYERLYEAERLKIRTAAARGGG